MADKRAQVPLRDRTPLDDGEQYLQMLTDCGQGPAGTLPMQLIRRLIDHGRAIERRNQILAGRVRELETELGRMQEDGP